MADKRNEKRRKQNCPKAAFVTHPFRLIILRLIHPAAIMLHDTQHQHLSDSIKMHVVHWKYFVKNFNLRFALHNFVSIILPVLPAPLLSNVI